ncbi:MAG: hypothetical protein ACI4PO_03005 [Faecousia sp.]
MKWGSFGPVHIATLILGAAMMMGLYSLLKNRSKRVQTIVLGVLSLYCVAAVTFDFLRWGSPLEYLPLHLCSFNALLLPIAIFSRNKVLCNMLLLWSLGAGAALLINTAQAEYVLLSDVFCFYFFSHVLEFGIPVLLFKLGLAEKDSKCILSTMLISIGIYTAVHFLNVSINAYCAANQILNSAGEVIRVNYMYSLWSDNALLDIFYRIIPLPYWYMYLIFPIIAVYLGAVYAPQILHLSGKQIRTPEAV